MDVVPCLARLQASVAFESHQQAHIGSSLLQEGHRRDPAVQVDEGEQGTSRAQRLATRMELLAVPIR